MGAQRKSPSGRQKTRPPESPSPQRDDGRRDLWFGTWSAIAGVIVAGVLTTGGTWLLQEQQNQRDDAQQSSEALGAARMLYRELATSAEAMEVFKQDRVLRPIDRSFTIDIEATDLRLIATQVKAEDWGLISHALARVDGVDGMVRSLLVQGRTKLNAREACVIAHDIRAITEGTYPVARLGGSEADQPELPAVTCDPYAGLPTHEGP